LTPATRRRLALEFLLTVQDASPNPAVYVIRRRIATLFEVLMADKEVRLTSLEYRLLARLAHHIDNVLTHRFLLEKIWGPPYVEEMHSLRGFMANLRRKIESDPARPRYLLTEQDASYRLADE
jgi:DNA-binding response OmpR family regulator